VRAKDKDQYRKNSKMETEITFTEKRRHIRHLLGLPIKYYLPNMEVGRLGFTLNISQEGLAVELPERLKVGDDLKLKILQKAQGFVEIIGRIVRIRPPATSGEVYQSGVRFLNLSPENKNKLGNLLVLLV